ncbi:XRE family transcriptional regulator [Paraburkholderia caribensis]|uniref:XRE family transcriptional regulator n=1 Tax=Paraburkholderia caribensis TaxID=75105 RepID=UPI001D073F88|nr:XRE family transcriptional regulator [Paraburkholderia caribensis]
MLAQTYAFPYFLRMSKTTTFLVSNLLFLIEKRGLNPNSLAEQVGKKPPQATIFRILSGESATPRDDTIKPLADFFGVSLQDLRYTDLKARDEAPPPDGGKDVSARITTILDEANTTVFDLAAAAEIPVETVQDWVEGRVAEIRLEHALGIERKFGYNPVWISKGKGQKKMPGIYHADSFNPVPYPTGHGVPVVGMAQLGDNGFWAEIEYEVGVSDGRLDFPSRDPLAYGVKCKGDSMLPRIKDGEFVVVEPNHPVEPGDEVLVRAKDGRVMVKILLYQRMGRTHLMSVNQDHSPLAIETDQIERLHYVVAIVKPSMWRHE